MAFISLKKTKNKENAKIQEKYKLKMGELILYYYFTHELCLYIEKQGTSINLQSYIKTEITN